MREYLVYAIAEAERRAFDPAGDANLGLDQGVFGSRVFPGPWIDAAALAAGDSARLLATLERGLLTSRHERFAAPLASAKG